MTTIKDFPQETMVMIMLEHLNGIWAVPEAKGIGFNAARVSLSFRDAFATALNSPSCRSAVKRDGGESKHKLHDTESIIKHHEDRWKSYQKWLDELCAQARVKYW